jgi:hypothetical protein
MRTISSFEGMEAWQRARELTRAIYALSNAGAFFPYPFFACPKNGYPQERAPRRIAPRLRRDSLAGYILAVRLRRSILDNVPGSAAPRWGFKTLTQNNCPAGLRSGIQPWCVPDSMF